MSRAPILPRVLIPLLLLIALSTIPVATHAASPIPAADFVFVGGGTAACAAAARLCRKLPLATLTILERGNPRSQRVRRLSLAARHLIKTWSEPTLTETFFSTPNPALNDRKVRVLLGSNIGGSSAVNAAKFTLPPAWYYPTLGITGLTGSRAANLLQQIIATLGVSAPPPSLMPDYTMTWLNAATRDGIPLTRFPFASPRNRRNAWTPRAAFDSKGRRVDANRGFLIPAMQTACRGRVRVVRGATVKRVRFESGRAIGAEVLMSDGSVVLARARKEVLMGAGAVNTAAVLQRSGVGPRDLLRRVGVPVVRTLPVGLHMQTRPVTVTGSVYKVKLARANNFTLLNKPWVQQMFDKGQGGPLGISPFGPNVRVPGLGYMGMQIGFEGTPPEGSDGRKQIGTTCLTNPSVDTYSTVRIRSRDALEAPVLDLKLLSRPADLKRAMSLTTVVRGIHRQLEGPMMAKENIYRKGESTETLATQAGLEKKVRADTYGANHYVGGSAVGRVLDNRLRVKGLAGLRVIDSGAIKRIPVNAGPLATVYIVGLHAAELIAADNPALQG